MQKGPLLDIRNTTRGPSPRIPFEKMARDILPSHFQLSLVFCGDTLSRSMNRTYRKKDYPPNVLSFPYEKHEGEIFINLQKAAKEAKKFAIRANDRIAHLFIHGCLHLLGWKHGARMDARERHLLRKYNFQTLA